MGIRANDSKEMMGSAGEAVMRMGRLTASQVSSLTSKTRSSCLLSPWPEGILGIILLLHFPCWPAFGCLARRRHFGIFVVSFGFCVLVVALRHGNRDVASIAVAVVGVGHPVLDLIYLYPS